MSSNYLICATPRTGTTLLCHYLTSTEVAGRPHSYFRKPDMVSWAEGWRISEQPTFDFDAINSRRKMLEQHNLAWQKWFQNVGVKPLSISYEALSADPIGCTKKVLEFLELELSEYKKLEAVNQRLADEVTVAWIKQFNKQLQNHAT